jgi:diguanylate cyclase (GGDEF)-like protein
VSALLHGSRASGLRTSVVGATVALVLAGGFLLALQYAIQRQETIADARTQAQVVASSSAAAVMFGDAEAVADTMASLGTLGPVRTARISNRAGEVVASYPARDAARVLPVCGMDCAVVRAPVQLQGEQVGTVELEVGMARVHRRLLGLAGAFLLASLAGVGLAMPLMRRARASVRAAEARLDYLAHVDPVTGRQNRNAFIAHMAQTPAAGPGSPRHALIQLDLDRFKEVNDTLGHAGGDELLRQVAVRIAGVLREGDQLFRLGGDEFAVLMAGVESVDAALAQAQAVLARLNAPFNVSGQQLFITGSAGVSLWPDDAERLRDLAGNADAAMYEAKRNGRNRAALFEPRLREAQAARLALQADLRGAMARGELRLHYQPQVDAVRGTLSGVEALLRWDRGGVEPVSPVVFIPIAEESGLIVEIGRWVIREACRQAQAWRDQGFGQLRVAVNLSVRQTRDEQLPAFIDAVLEETGVAPGCLELEITENLLMEETELAIALLARLRARGLHLAIDDFGTGYSSMAYLKRLPIDTLKIDMTFVRAIPGDGEAITTAILAMARQLGLAVVAEGVETGQQQAFLAREGCGTLQGYRFDPPLDPETFSARWLQPRTSRAP